MMRAIEDRPNLKAVRAQAPRPVLRELAQLPSVTWWPMKRKREHEAKKCEDCGLKQPSYGLPSTKWRRWLRAQWPSPAGRRPHQSELAGVVAARAVATHRPSTSTARTKFKTMVVYPDIECQIVGTCI
eukprot:SAG31_NODE_7149_length_1773_cov_5.681004_2_plen_128_part_00